MTKAEIISTIVSKSGVNKSDVSITIDTFLEVLKSTLESGDGVFVRGFGTFKTQKRSRRVARNIAKNTSIVIDAHYVPIFKPAKEFIENIKNSENLTKLLR
jgi:DNA-binding protein HU-beta